MIDQLLKIVQEQTQAAVVENEAVPNELNGQVQEAIASSIQNGLTSAVSGGNIGGLMELFGSGAQQQNVSGNPIVNMINSQLAATLSKNFNLPPAVSNMIAAAVIPAVMAKFTQKVADQGDRSIDMNGLIGSLLRASGGNQSAPAGLNFNDLLSDVASGKANQSDLVGMAEKLLTSGDQQAGGSGGLLGALGKMLGR